MTTANPACAITGASGYVGRRLSTYLQSAGWETAAWTRRAGVGRHVPFQLGQDVSPKAFANTRALVHGAYDFKARNWNDIATTNIRGSEKLFRAAREANVERIVFISSMSSFPGCRSHYGKAKLEIETVAASFGAIIIRPGLVYGSAAGGVFGGLVNQVKQSRFVPLLGTGRQPQYLVHDEDLGRLVARSINGEIQTTQPISLASEQAWPMRDLLSQLAAALKKKITFVPVPWRLIWLGLKSLESLHLPTPFRSDSLIGLIYQNPAPSFELAKTLRAGCRPFQITPEMLK